jgi:hypothetical protein
MFDKTMGTRRRSNRPSRRWNRNETSPGMGLRTAQPRRTRRKASQATPSPAAAPSAPACPPPPDPAPRHPPHRSQAHPDQERRYKAVTNRNVARGLAVAYLGEEQRAEEAGEEEEGAGEEHHGEPQSRSHQTRAAGTSAGGPDDATSLHSGTR